jgi:hypothetical protein
MNAVFAISAEEQDQQTLDRSLRKSRLAGLGAKLTQYDTNVRNTIFSGVTAAVGLKHD